MDIITASLSHVFSSTHLATVDTGRALDPRPVSSAVPPGGTHRDAAPDCRPSIIVWPLRPGPFVPSSDASSTRVGARERAGGSRCVRAVAGIVVARCVEARLHEGRRDTPGGAEQVGGAAGHLKGTREGGASWWSLIRVRLLLVEKTRCAGKEEGLLWFSIVVFCALD